MTTALPPVVLALVPPARAARLAAALNPHYAVLPLGRWSDVRPRCSGYPVAAAIDPLLLDAPPDQVAGTLRQLAEWVPVVLYTSFTVAAMHRVFDARDVPGAALVIEGLEDAPPALRRTFAAASASAHRLQALRNLRARAGPLPPDVDAALGELLARPGDFTVMRLAELAHCSRRTLERRLARAGSRSPRWLVRTARALLAHELLCTSSATVRAVTHDVGYAKLESLRALTRWSFGASPSAVRSRHVR